jgi:hypothetical protein
VGAKRKHREKLRNLSDRATKDRLLSVIDGLEGPHWVSIRRARPTRTTKQNAYYWAGHVEPFRDWLTETQGERFTDEQAHEVLASAFLPKVKVRDPATGMVIGEARRSTTRLTTEQFAEYMENIARFLAKFCDIAVETPQQYYARIDRKGPREAQQRKAG